MTISQYLSSIGSSSADIGNFMGNVLSTYYGLALSTNLNVSETNDLLKDFFGQTKLDIYAGQTFDPNYVYDVAYDNGTVSLTGTDINRIFLLFPSTEDMAGVIDEMRIKSKTSVTTINFWTLNVFTFNAMVNGVSGLTPSSSTWINYYNANNVQSTRNIKSKQNPNSLSTTDIASLLSFYTTKYDLDNSFIAAFVSNLGYTPSADLTITEFNDVMRNIYEINRLGSWSDLDIAYTAGSFNGADLAAFRNVVIKEQQIYDLMEKLMNMGYLYTEIVTFDMPFAVTLFENVHLGL